VCLVGVVRDRPFRPGGGSRVVVKLEVFDRTGHRGDQLEFDAFTKTGDFAMGLRVEDRISITGRLEHRTYTFEGEQVSEIRCVAESIIIVTRASDTIRSRGPAERERPVEHEPAAERERPAEHEPSS
jgi:hypothetical protein